ncbi:MAG: hypothetical protein UHO11_02380 [Treponema sp.]|nr:hypothetical protein [Treponema sp.]
MSTTNLETRDLAWALKTFRPLLKALKLQEIGTVPTTVFTSSFQIFNRYNMANCVILVKCKTFTNKDDRGIFVWQYDAETNMYALHIIINSILCENEELETRIKRKATGVHEFTHCVAAMMIFSRLQSKALIEILHSRMAKAIHSLDKVALENLFRELTMTYADRQKENFSAFPDEHFRITGEDFTGSYEDLNRNFLLSYELFCENEYFNESKQIQFRDMIKLRQNREAVNILVSVIQPLAESKALSPHFIVQRIQEEFFGRLISNGK